jgi:hypothetical protein
MAKEYTYAKTPPHFALAVLDAAKQGVKRKYFDTIPYLSVMKTFVLNGITPLWGPRPGSRKSRGNSAFSKDKHDDAVLLEPTATFGLFPDKNIFVTMIPHFCGKMYENKWWLDAS